MKQYTCKTLSIDIETYSSADLSASGIYRYAAAADFAVLLLAWSMDYGEVQIVDLASGEELPPFLIDALTDPAVRKTAFNAAFERVCLSRHLRVALPPEQWECTMVRCAMLGLPLSLAAVGEVLALDDRKMEEGRALIRYFSVPCKPTAANGMRSRNLPHHSPGRWAIFRSYCKRDVEVENSIRIRTAAFDVPPAEQALYWLDQRINDRGVMLDMPFVEQAIRLNDAYNARLTAEASRLTGLDNPRSVQQLKGWLQDTTGWEVRRLDKKEVPRLLGKQPGAPVRRLLSIRQELGKTSVSKYKAMQRAVCSDSRIRGMLQFYGAARTGRWAGRLVQVQNLPQNHLGDLALARSIVAEGDLDTLELCYGDVPGTLSQLIRTAFVARQGHTFVVIDFAGIEARVVAWLAGEAWRMEVFRTHGKIYEASASQMFHVDAAEITKGDPRRQKGKIAELALGYQGGVGALKMMGGEAMGLTEAEMKNLVIHWRQANPAIVSLWGEVQRAALACLGGRDVEVRRGVRFRMEGGAMTVELPSGRKLSYPRARVEKVEKYGRTSVSLVYEGMNQTTRRWERQDTYGGKLVENIVQAIARDCLAVAMTRLEACGLPIVFHVHDEVILEVPLPGEDALQEARSIFARPIPWAEGLPLKGDGYITPYYRKE